MPSYGSAAVISTDIVMPSEKMSLGYENGDGSGLTYSGGEYDGVPRPCGSVGKRWAGAEGGGRNNELPQSASRIVRSDATCQQTSQSRFRGPLLLVARTRTF